MFKTIILARLNITYLIKFLILLLLVTGAPLVGIHSQWITGPIVNAALILAVLLLDIRSAILIGILPSTIALSTGLLPAPLAPMVPFIIISNMILILIIDYFVGTGHRPVLNTACRVPTIKYFSGLFFAASLKYLFLFFTSGLVINLLLNKNLATKVAQMMSWPQFFTALIGGILAWGLLKILRK